jgi:predicted phage baseplate assembly protein
VEPSTDGTRTLIRWDETLDSVDSGASGPTPGLKLFHLRDRAALFGYNAPHPLVLGNDQRTNYGFATDSTADWTFAFAGSNRIHLDNIYKGFVAESWMVLEAPNGVLQSFRITNSDDDSLALYAISGRAQRLDIDTNGSNLALMEAAYRGISAYGGSVEIPLAEKPLTHWVAGSEIELDIRADDLPAGRTLILRGRRAMLRVTAQSITITADDGAARALTLDAIVTLLDEPEPDGSDHRFRLSDETGFVGTAVEPPSAFVSIPAPEDAEPIVRATFLEEVQSVDATHSKLVLTEAIDAAFDRTSLTIHANVARAAHGEGVTEILGHGDPSRPFQKFQLKQAPVTQRLAATEPGIESTLSVRIDGVEWEEVPDLYQRGANARVYKTSLTDKGETVVEFGDGISGTRPPAGRDNMVAEHSRGLGAAGNLRAGQLKLPLDRPLGLKETDNPLPATGGADPEIAADARRNAPIYTLTLGRVVSLTDYRDFALGYPGIAKAEARWIWQGETRRIVVTVAGDKGMAIPPGSTTYDNLLAAFRTLGDPLVVVDLLSFQPATFRLGLRVAVDAAYDDDVVLAATEAHLRAAFAFEMRDFGEVLSLSEVAAAAHGVDGLLAVDIDTFYRSSAPQADANVAHARLISQTGRLGTDGTLLPAEILTLDPATLNKLELMA